MKLSGLLIYLCLNFLLLLPTSVSAQSDTDWWANNWAMAGANPQRTSWTSHQVPSAEYLAANRTTYNNGHLNPEWFKPIKPFIPPKAQIIAAYNTLYISTANGLYALDASTGAEKWIYPTAMPLGHSPTIYNGVAYVGGFDQKIHAINAYTGQGLWTFTAGTTDQLAAGFDTNPLVVGDKLYAGNRNGVMYAIFIEGSQTGQLAWQHQTGGQIHFSAAYKDNAIYFASNDNHAYALNATTGALIWQSDPFPGEGFHSWWPVVYSDSTTQAETVIFVGTTAYRAYVPPRNSYDIQPMEAFTLLPGLDPANTYYSQFIGQILYPRSTNGYLDTSKSTTLGDITSLTTSTYFEQKPWRRSYFVLNRQTGKEITFDFNQNGQPEYAPILWFNTHSGNRYPPLIGNDKTLYQTNMYSFGGWIQRGQITSWQFGTPFINNPANHIIAVDEPLAYASGGNLIYWNHCCDRSAGAFDISIPNNGNYPIVENGTTSTTISIVLFPVMIRCTPIPIRLNDWTGVYGTNNGVYSAHISDQNPPIPYNNRVYIHRSNTIIAFSKPPLRSKPYLF
jgi:hypothetical protein